MIRLFLIASMLFLTANITSAVEIVYPKKNPVTINATSTFFIGAIDKNETLKINNVDIPVAPNGAFAHVVALQEGPNEFDITTHKENSFETLKFNINRPIKTSAQYSPPILIEYPQSVYVSVKNKNAPLRETPLDSGLNRLSHLPKGLTLNVNGEKGGFYRIVLNSNTNAWILKTDVNPALQNNLAEIQKIKLEEKSDVLMLELELSETPLCTLKEDDSKLTLKLYNVSTAKELKLNNPNLTTLTFEDSTLSLEFKLNHKLIGYDLDIDSNKLVFKIRSPLKLDKKQPLKNVAIVVDAGHGGAEYGAIGGCGHKEKDINLDISKKIEIELEKNGANVFMTRKTDNAVSLVDRAKFIKDKNAVIAISIHANAIPDGLDPNKKQGTSVYYYHNQASMLAQSVLNAMLAKLKTKDDKVRQASLALVRPTSAVSILIEVGYIINPEDYNMLLDPVFQQNCAEAIVEGLKNYLIAQ